MPCLSLPACSRLASNTTPSGCLPAQLFPVLFQSHLSALSILSVVGEGVANYLQVIDAVGVSFLPFEDKFFSGPPYGGNLCTY